jgi:hypothetical protein
MQRKDLCLGPSATFGSLHLAYQPRDRCLKIVDGFKYRPFSCTYMLLMNVPGHSNGFVTVLQTTLHLFFLGCVYSLFFRVGFPLFSGLVIVLCYVIRYEISHNLIIIIIISRPSLKSFLSWLSA